MDITPYLKLLRDKEGSDLFFSVGTAVKIKIEGQVSSVGKTVLTVESRGVRHHDREPDQSF